VLSETYSGRARLPAVDVEAIAHDRAGFSANQPAGAVSS
ncbi:MAG: hypothetical protein ACI89J_004523, partial [Hyphomicrobiaceae bacterium]